MISINQIEKRLKKLEPPKELLILFDKDGVLTDKFGERYSRPFPEDRQIVILNCVMKVWA